MQPGGKSSREVIRGPLQLEERRLLQHHRLHATYAVISRR